MHERSDDDLLAMAGTYGSAFRAQVKRCATLYGYLRSESNGSGFRSGRSLARSEVQPIQKGGRR